MIKIKTIGVACVTAALTVGGMILLQKRSNRSVATFLDDDLDETEDKEKTEKKKNKKKKENKEKTEKKKSKNKKKHNNKKSNKKKKEDNILEYTAFLLENGINIPIEMVDGYLKNREITYVEETTRDIMDIPSGREYIKLVNDNDDIPYEETETDERYYDDSENIEISEDNAKYLVALFKDHPDMILSMEDDENGNTRYINSSTGETVDISKDYDTSNIVTFNIYKNTLYVFIIDDNELRTFTKNMSKGTIDRIVDRMEDRDVFNDDGSLNVFNIWSNIAAAASDRYYQALYTLQNSSEENSFSSLYESFDLNSSDEMAESYRFITTLPLSIFRFMFNLMKDIKCDVETYVV